MQSYLVCCRPFQSQKLASPLRALTTTGLSPSHRYNTILTCVDVLMKYPILIPGKMGCKILTAAEIVQLFCIYNVRHVGVP